MSRIVYPKLMKIIFTRFSYAFYKVLSSITFLCTRRYFLLCFFHGLRKFAWTLLVFLFCACQVTHSFLNRFQPNSYQHFSLLVLLFSAWNKSITLQTDNYHNLDRQQISFEIYDLVMMYHSVIKNFWLKFFKMNLQCSIYFHKAMMYLQKVVIC